jgi:hypothetical protein
MVMESKVIVEAHLKKVNKHVEMIEQEFGRVETPDKPLPQD